MQYYRCKCGERTAFGSMSPYPCQGCPECNTTLETHPDLHREPKPHDFSEVQTVMTDEGPKSVTYCRWCMRRRDEIESDAVVAKAREVVKPIIEREAKIEADRPSNIVLD